MTGNTDLAAEVAAAAEAIPATANAPATATDGLPMSPMRRTPGGRLRNVRQIKDPDKWDLLVREMPDYAEADAEGYDAFVAERERRAAL